MNTRDVLGILITAFLLDVSRPLEQGQAATYVVAQNKSGAADTNPGTEEQPFRSIQHGADIAMPGDTVCVMAGNYAEDVQLRHDGAEGKAITRSNTTPVSTAEER
jgi:hypothetical protein